MDLRNTRSTILNEGDPEEKRAEILDYFHKTFTIDDRLYDTLASDDAFYLRAEPLRHPLIFYFGHTASFYINKLNVAKIIDHRINPRFESIFAIGVDEMSWDDLNQANYDWPDVDEVRDYRKKVRDLVGQVIQSLPISMPIDWNTPFWSIMMGIEHQRIHLETSSVIIRQLPIEQVQALPLWDICKESGDAPRNKLLPVSGGCVVQGKSLDHPLYGWDNEYGRREFDVEDFAASRYLVSNGEYREFINDGGYGQPDLWTEEGRNWLSYSNSEHPVFWIPSQQSGEFRLRTMNQVIDMPWNWPAEVNCLEAKAFCNWKATQTGKPIRLPTEDEWRRLHDLHEIPDQPYWETAPGNINLEHAASPCPVDRFAFGEFFDIIGNVWQWTETTISGFDGFDVHPWYDDFSTPTFDTQHNLIKGGSWISTGNEATRDSRYAFRRHFFQHAGFRYVESQQPVETVEAMYETAPDVVALCEADYGPDYFNVPNYASECVKACLKRMCDQPRQRALDLSTGVGRAAFELAREFESVDGIDYTARNIRIAFQMQEKGLVHYELVEEGELVSHHERRLNDLGLEEMQGRIKFAQADVANLKPQFTGYDLILAANLLDSHYNPITVLSRIGERLNPGGLLAIISPYQWDEERSAKENWVGGVRRDGEILTSLDGLKERLQENFTLIEKTLEIERVRRKTARTFEHSISQGTFWRKKDSNQ
jgi:5-histidylcysteine sulfoxide synthase/putative 4-mercaptohistidine N1-methyltranferase